MDTIYDSGWVPVASGSISASLRTGDYSSVRFIVAASGAAGCGATTASWSAGGATPIPWNKNTPNFPMTPLITGSYTVAAPAANTSNIYYVGVNISGTVLAGPTVPSVLNVSTIAGASSWARVIIEG